MKQFMLKNEEVASVTLALSHFLHAGIGTADALVLLQADEKDRSFAAVLGEMARLADAGQPLAKVFRQAGCFPDYVCTLLEVGERVGRPEETLLALSKYYRGRAQLQLQLKRTLTYPAVLLAVLLAVSAVLLIFVLPVFNDVYAQLGGSLTGIAGWLLALGQGLKLVLPGILFAGVAVALALVIPPVRTGVKAWFLNLFGDRGVMKKINTARFVQALALALESGMTVPEGVELAASLSKAPGFRKRCEKCMQGADAGLALSRALLESGLLERADSRLLEAGERSGRTDAVLAELTDRLLQNSEDALEQAAGTAEPAVVAIACVLIGAVLLSVMLPLMNIMTVMG